MALPNSSPKTRADIKSKGVIWLSCRVLSTLVHINKAIKPMVSSMVKSKNGNGFVEFTFLHCL